MTGYPWSQGDLLLANDLNAAIAANISGPFIPLNQAAVPNGVATLGATGIVPAAQLPPTVGTLHYLGGWNASTNVPVLASGASAGGVRQSSGNYYLVTVAGTSSPPIDGITTWSAGDFAVSNGSVWQRSQNTSYSGGTVTGPLIYTATGGTTPRAAQDRAADVANVLDFGADPLGVADSAAAINAACATGKAVYLPTGNYRITQQITVSNQVMYGDGRGQSLLTIPGSGFNASALGFVFMTGASAVGLRDIGFQFNQPDTTIRASLVVFPPAIYLDANARAQIVRVRVQGGASYGLDCRRNAAPYIEQLECCALVKGLMIDGSKDIVHLNGYHFWPFNLSTTLQNIYYDQTTVAAEFGYVDGLDCNGFFSTGGQLNFIPNAGNSGYFAFANVFMDTNAQTNISGPQLVEITNMMGSTTSAMTAPWINVTGTTGFQVKITNIAANIIGQIISVNNAAADVSIIGGELRAFNGATGNAATLTTGRLAVIGCKLTAGAVTNPFVAQLNGNLVCVGNWFSTSGTGVGISIASDNAGNVVMGNAMQAMTVAVPASAPLGAYGPATMVTYSKGLTLGPLGVTFSGGAAATNNDYTRHLALLGTNYGIGVSANRLNLGSNTSVYFLAGAADAGYVNITEASFASVRVGVLGTGPTVRVGTGAATGTQPKGSFWLRSDGAVGSTVYVSQGGGTWNAVAGV